MSKRMPEQIEDYLNKKYFPNKIKVLSYTGGSSYFSYQCLQCGKIKEVKKYSSLFKNKTLCYNCSPTRKSKERGTIVNFFKKNKKV